MKHDFEQKWTISELKVARESEDGVEFKAAQNQFRYDGENCSKPRDRRRCILGYVIALCNEGGGSLVLGMEDKYPHKVCGTNTYCNAVGQLEADIYNDTGIRTSAYELKDESGKRVVVIAVPSRPKGKAYKFEDVALMRVGEELHPMSEERLAQIRNEIEPDFSGEVFYELSIIDLDEEALQILRERYAIKQNNRSILSLPTPQLLTDLKLINDKGVTKAALILLGKKESLAKLLPQAKIMLEIRNVENKIQFDNRFEYDQAFFKSIDRLWADINMRNSSFPVKDGPYIYEIRAFNEEVIREAIANAVVHRDYRKNSEIVIKLYPQKFEISNAGGFPPGVTLGNLLTVPSTPRNRLLADVLSKTGIVERSGQGIDKIFRNTLSEGKKAPNYSASDDFHVELALSSVVEDKPFAMFIGELQRGVADEELLSVFEIVTLYKIKKSEPLVSPLEKQMLASLLEKGLIEKRGKNRGAHYILSKRYYDFINSPVEYFKHREWDDQQALFLIVPFLEQERQARMGALTELFAGHLSRRQVQTLVSKLIAKGVLVKTGNGAGTLYKLNPEQTNEIRALMESMQKLGVMMED